MERTRLNTDQMQWKNTGRKIFYLKNGMSIKPGATFTAPAKSISISFRDIIKPVGQNTTAADLDIVAVKVEYTIRKRGTSNWYDIVDKNDKVVNTKALKKDDAIEMIKNLEV